MYRCSLHIAVLVEKREIIKFLIRKFPNTLLHMGDNVKDSQLLVHNYTHSTVQFFSEAKLLLQINRTALHYAMALNKVELLSSILIRAGADRLAKDLVMRDTHIKYKVETKM